MAQAYGADEPVRFAVRLQPSRVYLVKDTLTGRVREATYDLRDALQVAARLEQSGGFATSVFGTDTCIGRRPA
jgi:hypothetical protein